MTVGQLREYLAARPDLADDVQVLIPGRHSLHACRAEREHVHPLNGLGQAQPDPDGTDGLEALVFHDASRG